MSTLKNSVFFPVRALNQHTRFPLVTLAVVVVNLAVFAYELTLDEGRRMALLMAGGAVPFEIVHRRDLYPPSLVPLPATMLTSLFLHGGVLHLLGNMWFLWVFGGAVEERMGRVRFPLFYVLAGLAGALTQCWVAPHSVSPMVGASGAVAGVLGSYLMLFPTTRVVTIVAAPFFWNFVPVPAWAFLSLWFAGQFLMAGAAGVAWMAHIGGFLTGLALVHLVLVGRNRHDRAVYPLTPDEGRAKSPAVPVDHREPAAD